MRGYASLLPVVALLCAAAATQAEVIDIAWGGDGRFESRTEIAAGKFVEVCGKLGAGLKVEWSFEAGGPVDFNIHYHQGKEVVYPARQSQIARGRATLRVLAEQDYCWMWTNKTTGAVSLKLSLVR